MSDSSDGATVVDVPLCQLLLAVDAELTGIGRLAERLQVALGRNMPAGMSNPAWLSEAQALDALTQQVFALSTFVATLAGRVPDAWRLDPRGAASSIGLGALAGRLLGAAALPPSLPGELDLF